MNERVKFIARYLQKDEPFIVLCERAGISRKTGYKWVERYEGGGVAALVERSRAPLSHPHAVPAAVLESIVAMRRRYPRWGPRKLLAILRRQNPTRAWPGASTVGDILRQRGLVRRRRRHRYSVPYAERLAAYAAPNAIWCADFNGHFAVGNARCHPLTVMDGSLPRGRLGHARDRSPLLVSCALHAVDAKSEGPVATLPANERRCPGHVLSGLLDLQAAPELVAEGILV